MNDQSERNTKGITIDDKKVGWSIVRCCSAVRQYLYFVAWQQYVSICTFVTGEKTNKLITCCRYNYKTGEPKWVSGSGAIGLTDGIRTGIYTCVCVCVCVCVGIYTHIYIYRYICIYIYV